MIQKLLDELQETWDYTTEELNDIRDKMVEYAFYATIDSSVSEEVMYLTEIKKIKDN